MKYDSALHNTANLEQITLELPSAEAESRASASAFSPQTYAPAQPQSAGNYAPVVAHRVESHIKLVRKIAWHVHARVANTIDIEDLIQIGLVALVEAARGYEDRGHAFATYASMRIRGSMIDALRRTATIARSAMANRKTISATRKALELQLSRAATDAEMAVAMGLPAAAYTAMVDACADTRQESMDAVYSDHNIWFADNAEAADVVMERTQLHAQLSDAIATLPDREARVLQLYFVEEMNLDEIGATLDIGAARVCQIKKAALEKVRLLLA
jgi:RNA polymerase sigma factor FliA